MARFEHQRARPLHELRHGWGHYRQHRDGVRHGHERRSRERRTPPPSTPREALRTGRRYLRSPWPKEVARQLALGLVLAAAVVFVVCVVWGALTILTARNDLKGAQGEATALAVDRTQLFTKAGRARADRQILAMERGAANAANLVGNSIPLKVLSWIPFVGQQVNGVTSLVDDFDTTSVQAGNLLTGLDLVIGASHGTTISLPAVSILQSDVDEAVRALHPLDRGAGLLIGPLATARSNFDKEIVRISALLRDGQHLLTYAGPFLGADGPRTYLIAGENNAEMRDQGAVLSWAVLYADNGTFTMKHPQSVGTLKLRHPAAITLPAGTEEAFSGLDPTQIWQSVNATADYALSGQVMAAMYHQRTHRSVDGVIAIDVPALEGVLKATGPVKVKNIPGTVTSKNAAWVLLHELYLLFPHNYEQGTRHDEVSAVAVAAVDKMKRHPYDLAYLVDQLAKATTGRHLLVWSRFAFLERAVERFGASGIVTSPTTRTIHLSIESAVAAKIDWYIHTAAVYHVVITPTGEAFLQAKIVIANTAPRKGPHYVLGPDHINSFTRGQYVGRLDLWWPRGSVVPGGILESGLVLSRTEIDVLPGHKETLVLYAALPHAVRNGRFSLLFVPQSTLWPQVSKVVLVAPGWSVSGGTHAVWDEVAPRDFLWQLSL